MAYRKLSSEQFRKLREEEYNLQFGDWDKDSFYAVRSLFLYLVTGEPDFEVFYRRFDATAFDHGHKPIAWGPGFWPDLMDDVFWSDEPLDIKVKQIKDLYAKCIKAEKAFKRKNGKKKKV